MASRIDLPNWIVSCGTVHIARNSMILLVTLKINVIDVVAKNIDLKCNAINDMLYTIFVLPVHQAVDWVHIMLGLILLVHQIKNRSSGTFMKGE